MDQDLMPVIIFIMGVAIIGMLVLFIAGDLHDQGRTDESETFYVSDPSVDRSCALDHEPDNTPTVKYYNGTAWTTLGVGDYTLTGKTLVVSAAVMD